MIVPFRQGPELIQQILATRPSSGSLAIWWLGQSGFLIKTDGGILVIDPYLSEHLTRKYEGTARPHVRMTRAPSRGRPGDGRPGSGLAQAFRSPRPGDHERPPRYVARGAASAAGKLA